jgi:hypothetical protein
MMGYTIVESIHEQSDADVHDLCHERIPFPIWSVSL